MAMFSIKVACLLGIGASLIVSEGVSAQPIELITMSETEVLRPVDAEQAIFFGNSIATDGDLAAIGAWGDGDNGVSAGAVYVFRFDGEQWIEEAKLLASDGSSDDAFGWSVDIDGGNIVVGAFRNSELGFWAGAAYVYRHDGQSWIEEAKLTAIDGKALDAFGLSVAIEENRIVVGAPGIDSGGSEPGFAYIYQYNGIEWVEQNMLVASDGLSADAFGRSVAISDDICIVAAPGVDHVPSGTVMGAVYPFRYDGLAWVEQPRIEPEDVATGFGRAIAFDGSMLAVGAPRLPSDVGSVSIYQFDDEGFELTTTLLSAELKAYDLFGTSVDLKGDRLLVGSNQSGGDSQYQTGDGYLYERVNSEWVLRNKLVKSVPDGTVDDYFGAPVAIGENALLISAYQDQSVPDTAGVVYSYLIDTLPCGQDFNNDGAVDIFDVFAFLEAFVVQDPSADWDGNGAIGTNDVAVYIDVFSAGCL